MQQNEMEAVRELAAHRELLEKIVNRSPAVAFLWKAAAGWPVEYVSDNISAFGYDSSEFLNGTVSFSDIVHPEDLERIADEVASFTKKNCDRFSQEYRLVTKDGDIRWVDDRTWVQRDEGGQATYYQGMLLDITERKAMEAQLRQAQKMQSIGQLAAGIAHEINTPVQFIGDNTRFIRKALTDLETLTEPYEALLYEAEAAAFSPDVTAQIHAIRKVIDIDYVKEQIPRAIGQSIEGIKRITEIVQAMKEFSHPGDGGKSKVDINRAIESTIIVARNEWKYVAALTADYDRSLSPVYGLPGEFNQAILNILVNAAHAIGEKLAWKKGEKGRITISTYRNDDGAEIRITDTGGGIPKPIQERIFDPFFTTKEVGRGTGQGLYIAYDVIVNKHQGELTFETKEGQGTTFIIRLPAVVITQDRRLT